jgi:hypothetical protein
MFSFCNLDKTLFWICSGTNRCILVKKPRVTNFSSESFYCKREGRRKTPLWLKDERGFTVSATVQHHNTTKVIWFWSGCMSLAKDLYWVWIKKFFFSVLWSLSWELSTCCWNNIYRCEDDPNRTPPISPSTLQCTPPARSASPCSPLPSSLQPPWSPPDAPPMEPPALTLPHTSSSPPGPPPPSLDSLAVAVVAEVSTLEPAPPERQQNEPALTVAESAITVVANIPVAPPFSIHLPSAPFKVICRLCFCKSHSTAYKHCPNCYKSNGGTNYTDW